MRKVVSGLFISLDGVVESPDKWQFDSFDEVLGEALSAHIADEDTVLLGRVTYQEWAPYWPTATDEPYASHINNVSKYVVSTTLDTADWQNSTLVKGDVAAKITELKKQSGGNIGVAGSPTLVSWLLRNDLLDELVLMVHPVIAGTGRRLFRDGAELKRLHLASTVTTPAGVAILTYQPRTD
jgi:dihydrofolate reductase